MNADFLGPVCHSMFLIVTDPDSCNDQAVSDGDSSIDNSGEDGLCALPAQSSIELGVYLVVRTMGQCTPATSALYPVVNPTTGQMDGRLAGIS